VGAQEDLDIFDPAGFARGLRRDAEAIEELLKALPVEKQVDENVKSRLLAMEHTREHLLIYAFLVEHEDDLDRHAAEIQEEIAAGAMKPGPTLQDVIAQFG